MKRIIMDIDETICTTKNGDYRNAEPIIEVIEKIKENYKNIKVTDIKILKYL